MYHQQLVNNMHASHNICRHLATASLLLILCTPALAQPLSPQPTPPRQNSHTTIQSSATIQPSRSDYVDACMRRAAKYLSQDRDREAADLYRLALYLQPDNTEAYNSLIPLTITLSLPDPSSQIKRLLSHFNNEYALYQSPHFLVVHNNSLPWAENRARMLELTYNCFFDVFSWAHFQPIPPAAHLHAIAFSHHSDFINYAKTVDGKTRDWFHGYYSARTNRIALYDYQTSPKMAEASKKIAQLTESEKQLTDKLAHALKNHDSATAANTRASLYKTRNQLKKELPRHTTIVGLNNIAHSIHETAHQLAFNTGIQKRGVTYPIWFSEGLATAFETTTPAVGFGPHTDNRYRRRVFSKNTRQNKLIPPDQFISMIAPPDHDEEILSAAYAQSWATFHYLFNRHPVQLRKYIVMKLKQQPGRLNVKQLHDEFVQFFGQPKIVHSAVIKHIHNIR